MRRGAAPPSSQLGLSGAPGAPGPSIGRSSSSTPCRGRVEKSPRGERRTLQVPLQRVKSAPPVVRSAGHGGSYAGAAAVARGCTYPSAALRKGGYPGVARVSWCICPDAFFLIRSANNLGSAKVLQGQPCSGAVTEMALRGSRMCVIKTTANAAETASPGRGSHVRCSAAITAPIVTEL
jgi:hypothetical protein